MGPTIKLSAHIVSSLSSTSVAPGSLRNIPPSLSPAKNSSAKSSSSNLIPHSQWLNRLLSTLYLVHIHLMTNLLPKSEVQDELDPWQR